MRLFEITQQFKSLEALADSEELAPEFIADTLESLQGDFETKVVAVAQFILSLEAESKAIEAAAQAMMNRQARIEKRAASIRAYLLLQFQALDWRHKITTPEIIVSRRSNPVAVQISDESTVPAQFWVQPEPPPKRIDKKSLKAALQSGTEIPGCYLESGERIDIRL